MSRSAIAGLCFALLTMMYDLKAGMLRRKRLAMAGKENNKMSSGVCTAYVRSKYGASTEQVPT